MNPSLLILFVIFGLTGSFLIDMDHFTPYLNDGGIGLQSITGGGRNLHMTVLIFITLGLFITAQPIIEQLQKKEGTLQ